MAGAQTLHPCRDSAEPFPPPWRRSPSPCWGVRGRRPGHRCVVRRRRRRRRGEGRRHDVQVCEVVSAETAERLVGDSSGEVQELDIAGRVGCWYDGKDRGTLSVTVLPADTYGTTRTRPTPRRSAASATRPPRTVGSSCTAPRGEGRPLRPVRGRRPGERVGQDRHDRQARRPRGHGRVPEVPLTARLAAQGALRVGRGPGVAATGPTPAATRARTASPWDRPVAPLGGEWVPPCCPCGSDRGSWRAR